MLSEALSQEVLDLTEQVEQAINGPGDRQALRRSVMDSVALRVLHRPERAITALDNALLISNWGCNEVEALTAAVLDGVLDSTDSLEHSTGTIADEIIESAGGGRLTRGVVLEWIEGRYGSDTASVIAERYNHTGSSWSGRVEALIGSDSPHVLFITAADAVLHSRAITREHPNPHPLVAATIAVHRNQVADLAKALKACTRASTWAEAGKEASAELLRTRPST